MNLLQRICPTVLQRVPASNRSGFATVALVCLGWLSLVSLAQATTDQTITFPALPDKVLGDAPFAAGGSAIPSNLPVSYTSSNPDVATVSGSTITLHAAGTTIITAKQDGNATYNAANWVERPLHVLTFAATTAGSSRISRWKDDKTAAYLLMFDDVLASRASVVVPEMKARGLRGTFYTVPNHYSSVPSYEAIWQETDVVAFGNHTWDHQNPTAPRPTATMGSDYTATSGTLNWAPGDTTDKTFTVPISADTQLETDEEVTLTLSGPTGGAVLGALPKSILKISDNDAPGGTLRFSSPTIDIAEGNAGTTTAIINVTRSGGSTGVVTVNYGMSGGGPYLAGTASNTTDYTATSGTLTWAAGETADKTINIPIIGDNTPESNETVILTLSNPTGGARLDTTPWLDTPSMATLTITNDDGAPAAGSIQFSSATYSKAEGNSGTSTINIVLTRTGGSTGSVGVKVSTRAGTATAGNDYTEKSEFKSWGAGDTGNKNFTVTLNGDTAGEGNETVIITMNPPTGGAVKGSIDTATLTITNDDAVSNGTLQFKLDTYPNAESGTATITVSRASGSTSAVAVNYSTGLGDKPINEQLYDIALNEQIAPARDSILSTTGGANSRLLSFALPGTNPSYYWPEFISRYPADFQRLLADTHHIERPLFQIPRATSNTWNDWVLTAAEALALADQALATQASGVIQNTSRTNAGHAVGMEYLVIHGIENPGATGQEQFWFARAEFLALLDGLKARQDSGAMWVTDHISWHQYNQEFQTAKLQMLENTGTLIRFTLTDTLDDIQYDHPLTLKTRVPAGWTTARVAQGGVTTDRPVVNGFVQYEVKSNGAEVALSPINVVLPGTIQFSAATYTQTEGHTGTTLATITATRTGGSNGPVSVFYSTSNGTAASGTAASGTDYTAASSILNWADGETGPKDFAISIIGDTAIETDETVNLTLSNPAGGATLGIPSTALLTITNDDGPSMNTRFWDGTGTWTDANSWSLTTGGPYNQSWTSGDAAVFDVANSTITGASTNFSSITANQSVTFTPGGTLGTGGTVATVTVNGGAFTNLNFGTQAISTAPGTGFIKDGVGVWAISGTAAYPGNFTINAGTVAMGHANALGGTSASRTLTINGGTIRSNGATDRDLGIRFGGGIIIGGDVTLGAAAPTAGAMSFGNNVTLGAATRQITTDGTVTLSGIISGSTGVGITKAGASTLTLSGVNTYTGDTTVNTGTLILAAGSSASPITVKDGAFLGFTLGTSISSSAAVTLEAGAEITVTGIPTLASYTLITATSITGTPVLATAVPGYVLVKDGNTLKLNSNSIVQIPPNDLLIAFRGVMFPSATAAQTVLDRHTTALVAGLPSDPLRGWARCQTGVVLSFQTASPNVTVKFATRPDGGHMAPPWTQQLYAVYRDGSFLTNHLAETTSLALQGTGATHTWDIVLPIAYGIHFTGLDLDAGHGLVALAPETMPAYVAIGDSITQGFGELNVSLSSVTTYPWKLAAANGWRSYNLGISGSSVTPAVADGWPALNPTVITILWGYNDWNGGTALTTIQQRLTDLVVSLRAQQPNARIYGILQTATTTVKSPTVDELRQAQRQAFEALINAGDQKLFVLDGSTMTDTNDLADAVHLNAAGAERFAERLSTAINAGSIQFSSATYTQAEGNTGTTLATLTATRTGGSSGAVSVSYATANGTATAGSDYTAASGLLTWDDGETGPINFAISITGDTTTETDETVNLTLSNPTGGATLGTPATAVLTITNDDASSGATKYWKGSGTWTDANSWSLSSGGPYNQSWVSGDAAVFDVAGSTITGATTNFSSITANVAVAFTAGGTLGTGGTVATITVNGGAFTNLNFGSQAISTAAGTGFIKNGAGIWALAGSAYPGDFTINAGTVAMANINALGGTSATRTLTLNGGTIRSNGATDRDLGTRFGGGIIIGGDMILGAAAPTEGVMSFGNNITLGTATRQITTDGTVTLSGIISGSAGAGITKAGVGTLTLSGANTYTGPTTINTGTLALAAGSSTSPITVKNGAFLGFTIGSSITSSAALTLEAGAKITVTGSPTLASYTVFTATSITGTPELASAIPGYALVKDGNTLKLNTVSGGSSPSWSLWSSANAGGQTPELDWDNDGLPNGIEYFINPAAGFTANPTITGANTITWPNGGNIPASAYGTRFVVQTSTNLQAWTDVPANQLTTNTDGPGGALTYTLTGTAQQFVRLKVTP